MITVHNEHEAMLHFLSSDDAVMCNHDGFTHTAIGFHDAAAWFRSMQRTAKPPHIVSAPKPLVWYSVKRDGLPPPDQKVLDADIITWNDRFKRKVYMDEWTGSKFASGDGVIAWMIVEDPV